MRWAFDTLFSDSIISKTRAHQTISRHLFFQAAACAVSLIAYYRGYIIYMKLKDAEIVSKLLDRSYKQVNSRSQTGDYIEKIIDQ